MTTLRRCLSAVLFFLASIPFTIPLEAKPVTITITNLWQIGSDFDIDSLGDFYAHVTINGKTLSSYDQRLDFGFSGYLVPTGPLLPPPLWVFSVDVPDDATTVPVRIEIFDADPISDDKADINPGPKDSIDLQVDLATGKWTGDVNWPDTCSAGPFDLDSKSAGVCFDVSVLSATGDADGDGIPDGWELWGYRDPGNGFVIDLPGLGASPFRKDVFVEVDCLSAPHHSHCPLDTAVDDVVRAFANAPVPNPDGTTGVQLHVDVGDLYGTGRRISIAGPRGVTGNYGDFGGGTQIDEAGNEIIRAFDKSSGGTDFFDLKRQFFDGRRAPIFRYVIFGHQTNGRQATNDCTSGVSDGIPGRDLLVTLGGVTDQGNPCWGTDVSGMFSIGTRKEQAGTFMHELGHTLGLHHGGATDTPNFKPNYLSVMNYASQMCSVAWSPDYFFPGGCDYSREALPSLVETDLDECVGLGAHGFGPVDWNHKNGKEGLTCPPPHQTNSTADLNMDGICVGEGGNGTLDTLLAMGDDFEFDNQITDGFDRVCSTFAMGDDKQVTAVGSVPSQPAVLDSFDDWSNLKFSLLTIPGSGGSGVSSRQEADPKTIREARAYLGGLLAPAVTVDKSGPPTAKPGDVLTFIDTISNSGYGPALKAMLTDVLPDGTTQTFDLNAVVAGSTKTQTTTFTVPSTACPGDFPLSSAKFAYENFVADPGSVSASKALQILDVAAPTMTVSPSPAVLWPPDHKMRAIVITIAVQDNCDANPKVTLVSIVSNEPDSDFLGQGDEGPDIADAQIGGDDRAFSLRAERATSGHATGRVYTITYRATDKSGNSRDVSTTVTVPVNSP